MNWRKSLPFLLLAAAVMAAFLACQDKIPPVGIEDAGTLVANINPDSLSSDVDPPQECEPDCGGGDDGDNYPVPTSGSGLSGWKYLWRDPSAMGSLNDAIRGFAKQQFNFVAPTQVSFVSDAYNRRRIPTLMDKENQAEQIALAKAIVFRLDSNTNNARMAAGT